MISLNSHSSGWQLSVDGELVAQSFDGSATAASLLQDEVALPLPLLESNEHESGLAFRYGNARFSLDERVQKLPDGLVQVERSWTNHSSESQEVAFLFELHTLFEPTFTLIPCVSYNGNAWGTGLEPKGLECDGQPWVFSYRRVSIPSATFSENSRMAVAVFVDHRDAQSLNSACSMEKTENGMVHRLFWPEREGPKTYISKNQYGPARKGTLYLAPGETFTARFYIAACEVKQERTGWTRAFDYVQELSASPSAPAFPPEQVWNLAVQYTTEVLFQRIGGMRAFHMGLLPTRTSSSDRGWKLREGGMYQIGWCGQNATLAHALLHDYQKNGNPTSLEQAQQVLDTWVEHGRSESGLFVVELDDILLSKTEFYADTCNLGWGAWQVLLAYQKAQELGMDKPKWLSFGLGLCDFFVSHEDELGRFGKLWTLQGECLDRDGTIGAFIILPLLQAYRMTRNEEYLQRAMHGFNYYVTHDLNRIECTAGALDTHCIDKETCWPLLAGALDLYEITGEKSYLDIAVLAGYYTLSWMFHYDALYDEGSDFARYGYSTRGATSVSTQHHHLDPWGALLCRDWLRLYQHTGDDRWRDRAQTTWANSLLALSDGTLQVRGRVRPAGSQNEAYCHCFWGHPGERVIEGEMNDWLVAWPGAFRLLTLMDTNEWDWLRA